jgi:hypothetical protein
VRRSLLTVAARARQIGFLLAKWHAILKIGPNEWSGAAT